MGRFSKTIGIVGGAGPMGSACLYRAVLEACQKNHGVSDSHEFPEIVLVSYPFTRDNPDQVRKEVSQCFAKLKNAGVDLVCIASNSFHAFLPDLAGFEFVHLIAEGLKEAERLKISRALILAGQRTVDAKLYDGSTAQCLYPTSEEQQVVNRIIGEVAGGKIEASQAEELKKLIDAVSRYLPIDGVIIACTELPLVHKQFSLSIHSLPVIDTVAILAQKVVERALKEKL